MLKNRSNSSQLLGLRYVERASVSWMLSGVYRYDLDFRVVSGSTVTCFILQVPRGAITMCVFKLYMGHILGSCDQSDAEAALSGPLLLYHHQPRSEVGRVLITTPDLGSPAHYIPTFYQECSFIIPTANHEVSA